MSKHVCMVCGAPMKARRETYRYDESGLPVVLHGVEVRRCTKCHEHEVVIPRIEELHRVLARAVSRKPSRLLGAEVRFLRKYLGWSGQDFGRHMGVTPEQVSRWENDRMPMGATADRLLRLMVATTPPVDSYPLDALAELGDDEAPFALEVSPTSRGWKAA